MTTIFPLILEGDNYNVLMCPECNCPPNISVNMTRRPKLPWRGHAYCADHREVISTKILEGPSLNNLIRSLIDAWNYEVTYYESCHKDDRRYYNAIERDYDMDRYGDGILPTSITPYLITKDLEAELQEEE